MTVLSVYNSVHGTEPPGILGYKTEPPIDLLYQQSSVSAWTELIQKDQINIPSGRDFHQDPNPCSSATLEKIPQCLWYPV